MRQRLPPLNALKAFEAAARHESFTRAAEELCVTQGAVSHQVKALEGELGIAVRQGDGSWPGLDAVKLSAEQMFPVCSPKLLGRRRLSKPADILKYPLIHLNSRTDWTKWLQAAGLDASGAIHGPVLNRD